MLTLSEKHRGAAGRLEGSAVVTPAARDADETAFLASLAGANSVLSIRDEADPRLVFAGVLTRYFSQLEVQLPPGIDPSARVDPSARIAKDVTISAFCFVGPEVEIGDGTLLHPGVVVHSRSIIGQRCILNSHCVIGNRGFGFVRQRDGSLVHFPQTGRVVLEDDVEIQSCTIVDRPGMGETRILRGSKIDNLVHVAHGARVGPHAAIIACAEIGAEVVIGEAAWLGPNACSLERVRIGDRAFVGAGAAVLKDVAPGTVVAGSPAEPTDVLRARRAAVKRLMQEQQKEQG
jgi:UDP-3-O-[3-hydroxymyristoyl] glucosamine N-acyltransferase